MLQDVRELEQCLSHLKGGPGGGATGMWQCDLPDETLTWTDGVYDIFELPRGFRVTRQEALGFYTPNSRDLLEEVRRQAIHACRGFTLETDITTALGNSRRLRIIAHIGYEDGKPVRIFGIKEDITRRKTSIHRPAP